ncbi:hypothetical protein JX266_006971 [Neoarthrinium moseri]|nr:hypothetical protein JX266_006971 [Neoarthrinium moseri]
MDPYDLLGPALAPPQGLVPTLGHPSNNNNLALASFIVMMVVSTICVILRGYGKVGLKKKIDVENGFILAAYGNYWGCTYASFSLIDHPGYFVHNWDISLGDTILPYCAAFGFAAIFLLNFQCVPHEAIWDFTIKEKTCLPLNPLQLTSATIHLISDIAIFILPQKIIWSLNMSLRKRFGVAIVFSLGALAVLCSIFRMIATINFGKSPDTMYNIGPVILWATGEVSCGFFVACMPTLPRLLKEAPFIVYLKKTMGSTTSAADESSTARFGHGFSIASHKLSRGTKSHEDYLQIDDDPTPLKDLSSNNSDQIPENVCNGDDRITKTTYIAVTREDGPSGHTYKTSLPWESEVG